MRGQLNRASEPLKYKIVIHAGTPKTGTTSIQQFLAREKDFLSRNGFTFCPGPRGKPNFKELFLASVSAARARNLHTKRSKLPTWLLRLKLRRYIAQRLGEGNASNVIVSTAVLSLLRETVEVQRLRDLFPPECEIAVVICLRDKQAFLASYSRQIRKLKRGIELSSNPNRSTYVQEDSWLVDYDSLCNTMRSLTADVRIIDYDHETRAGANIIEAFCRTVGIAEKPIAESLLYLNRAGSEPLQATEALGKTSGATAPTRTRFDSSRRSD